MTRSDDAMPHGRTPVGDQPPIDPDVDTREDLRHHPGVTSPGATSRWPRLRPDVVAVVFAGGCVGGYARYAVTQAWAASRYGFPWSTFAVNVAGAFILALVIVIASDLRPIRYLRPLLGTGFCGALTTFSSVVVAADQLIAHGHLGTAVAYLAATTLAGLTAAVAGFGLGRGAVAFVTNRCA